MLYETDWRKRAPWLVGARVRIGLAFSALALMLFGAVGVLSSRDARIQSERDTVRALQQLADRLAQHLDADMAARFRDIGQLAMLTEALQVDMTPAQWRQAIQRLHASSHHYSWIGVTDAHGQVQAATQGLLEKADVSQRPWFIKGWKQTSVLDVHEAKLLARVWPKSSSGEPLRFVDVAAPIRKAGRTVGVIGAHLSWQWAQERRKAVLREDAAHQDVEILLMSREGRIDLGPSLPHLGPLAKHRLATLIDQAQVLEWSDGQRYLTAARASGPMADYPGMGWVVLVREPEASAMSAAVALERRLLWFSGLGVVMFGVLGWLLADRLTRPLRQVAARAHAMRHTQDHAPAHDEVDQLAHVLESLLADLEERERALKTMNERLESRVAERTASLRLANEDLRGFSRSVSHDIQGPLGSMAMLLKHTLAKKPADLPESVSRVMTVVADECDRLRQLSAELLTLAMVEQSEIAQDLVDHGAMVRAVVDQLRQAETGTFPTVDIGPLPALTGDAMMLRQVWSNLLSNAVKFSSKVAHPRIEVSASIQGDAVQFMVADNGAGFDESQRERLFGVFQRLHTSAQFPGTGVGLSIVRRVVQRHGGRVWAESPPGLGARFYFVLPHARKTVTAPESAVVA